MAINSTSETTNGDVTCPLCGRECPDHSDLRVHLNVDHRKSEVADTLLAAVEGRA